MCDNQYQEELSLSVRRDQYCDVDLEKNDEYEINEWLGKVIVLRRISDKTI